MSPATHLFASWLIGAKGTDNERDCRLVALAGILPDADGLPLLLDRANYWLGRPETNHYGHYHHFLLHGAAAAVVLAVALTIFARQRWRVFGLVLLAFHVHLLGDLLGSRGPDPSDLWPLFYLGPISKEPMWLWQWQWPLDSWPNKLISLVLFAWCLRLALARGYSFVGVFSRRADIIFVRVLRGWARRWQERRQAVSVRSPDRP